MINNRIKPENHKYISINILCLYVVPWVAGDTIIPLNPYCNSVLYLFTY